MPGSTPNVSRGIIAVDEADRFKLAQALYNTVTGKTEKITQSFGKNYLIRSDDFRQLHLKCEQASSQWEVLQKNSSITVHHLNDNKEVFSSIERFNIYDKSRTSPTESVVYELNLLLRLPDIEKPQPYKITVRTLSKIAMFKRMDGDMAPPPFLRFFTSGNIVVEVDFVDYNVARNLQGVVESWVNEIEIESEYSWIERFQRHSHWFPPCATFIVVLLAGYTLFSSTPTALPDNSVPSQLAQWLILAGTFLLLSGMLARTLGRLVESGVDRVLTISAIQINKGDERLLTKFRRKNLFRTIQSAVAFLILIFQGVSVGLLVEFLRPLISAP